MSFTPLSHNRKNIWLPDDFCNSTYIERSTPSKALNIGGANLTQANYRNISDEIKIN